MSDEELLWLVRHKVRRAIIIAVGEEGRIGATALKQKLGISTGSLYYNLRQMSQLITQDEKKNIPPNRGRAEDIQGADTDKQRAKLTKALTRC
jgi:hypothetical protein